MSIKVILRLTFLIWLTAGEVHCLTLRITEVTSSETVNNFLLYSVRSYNDFSFIFPFVNVQDRTPTNTQFTLSFVNNESAATSKLQIFKVSDHEPVLRLQQDHLNKALFLDLAQKALDCKDYFSDCETSFLKSQYFRAPIYGNYTEQSFLIYYFTPSGVTTADFQRSFEIAYSLEISTPENYLIIIYSTLVVIILINIFSIFKRL